MSTTCCNGTSFCLGVGEKHWCSVPGLAIKKGASMPDDDAPRYVRSRHKAFGSYLWLSNSLDDAGELYHDWSASRHQRIAFTKAEAHALARLLGAVVIRKRRR